jgi:dolichyl-phosphate beta-glucosyltransferase
MKRLSIIVPAYNEQDRLGPMLSAYLPYFTERFGTDFELVVSVNGSRDATETVARSFLPAYPSVLRVLVTPEPIGKGAAILVGGKTATGDLIGFVDADGATPPSAFLDLVDSIGDAGLILASRRLPGAVVSPRQPLRRRIASRVFNAIVRALFKIPITDTQCGAKLLSADAWNAVAPKIGLTRWAFDVDLIFQTRRAHYPIREIPTVWHDVPGSRLRLGRTSLQMFLAVCRLRLLHSPFRFLVALYDRIPGRFVRLNPYTAPITDPPPPPPESAAPTDPPPTPPAA